MLGRGRSEPNREGVGRSITTAQRAEELGSLLYESGRGLGPDDVLESKDWLDQRAEIVRNEPGALWFRNEDGEELGPVRVPDRAGEIAAGA